MGSSRINEDSDLYDHLCNQYNETPGGLYGEHYDWIVKSHKQETTLSFEDYELKINTERLEYKIKCLEKEIEDKKAELENLKNNK